MGRGNLNMELISKERSRILTFKKRKEGLIKKLHEFTTLCDVSACMIIYNPIQENSTAVRPEIWPQNPDEVRRLIGVYKAKSHDSGSYKSFGLSDFFHDRKRKVEEELAKLHKKNLEAKYPSWNEFLNFLSEAELRALAVALNNKAGVVNSRIGFLKRKKQESGVMTNMMMMVAPAPSNLSQSHSFYNLNHQEIQPFDMGSLYHNSGGNNMHCASFHHHGFYDQVVAVGDGQGIPMTCYNHTSMPLPQMYYAPPVLQPVPPPTYMQWPMISEAVPPAQLQLLSKENLKYRDDGADDDIVKHLLQFN